MTTIPSATPAGYYPDPEGSPYQRWWDGAQWGNLQNGDFSAFSPNAVLPAPPGYYPDPEGAPRRREWTGRAWGHPEPTAAPVAAPSYVPPAPTRPDFSADPTSFAPVGAKLPPPGMYPDPQDPSNTRYWNGSSWSAPATKPRFPERFSLSSFHIPNLTTASGSRTPLLAGVLGLILVIVIGYALFSGGSSPSTSASTTSSTSIPASLAAFCATVASYDSVSTTGLNPATGASATTLWSSRAEALDGTAQEISYTENQLSIITPLIRQAPTPDIQQAYTIAKNYSQRVLAALLDSHFAFGKLSPSAHRNLIQATLHPFEKRVLTNTVAVAGAIAPVISAVNATCPNLSTTSTTLPAG